MNASRTPERREDAAQDSDQQAQDPRQARAQGEAPFVLPKPPRARGQLVVERGDAPSGIWQRLAGALATSGGRQLPLLECQDHFLAELRTALGELQTDRPDLGGHPALATALRVIDWCEAVQADLMVEAQRAAAGQQPLDLLDLCQDIQHELGQGSAEQPLQVTGCARRRVWGSLLAFRRAVQLGIGLVATRVAGQGSIVLEVDDDERGPHIRIAASTRAVAEPSREDVDSFRLAVEEAGIIVLPGGEDPTAAALVLTVGKQQLGPLMSPNR